MPPPKSAISVHLARSLLVSGCAVEGEVELDFRELQQDNIQEVHVKLRGSVRTEITVNTTTDIKVVHLIRDDASLWSEGGAYPQPGSDTLRIPFRFQLPPDLPPSFHYSRYGRKGAVRYAVIAVGTRSGVLHFNRRVRAPLAIVPKDHKGVALREKLALLAATGAETEWRTERKEEKIRRGLWGDYSTVQVELKIPDVPMCPLYVPIPFIIKIKTISAPLTRAKADAHPPDTPVFPQVPAGYDAIQFKLRNKLFITTGAINEKVSADVVAFTPHADSDVVLAEDVPARRWVPLGGTNEKEKSGRADPKTVGTWVQEATFRSTFRLDCPPTFALSILTCDYQLALKVPFPGVGNDVSLAMPIVITSGIDTPLDRDQPNSSSGPLDLPPSYWDAGDGEWDDDVKE